jgi:hypothetical protein
MSNDESFRHEQAAPTDERSRPKGEDPPPTKPSLLWVPLAILLIALAIYFAR